MRVLEAEAAAGGRSSRRPTTCQRGAAFPPGGVHQRPGRGLRAGRSRARSGAAGRDLRRPRHRPAGRRRTIIDDAHHHDRSPPRRAALPRRGGLRTARLPPPADDLRLHAARPARGHPGRDRLRGDGRVRGPARAGLHRRRRQPRRVPGPGHRLHPGHPAVPRRRRSPRSGRRWRSASWPVAGGSASIPPSASCSPGRSPSASCCSARSRDTSPTCSATCSATCSGITHVGHRSRSPCWGHRPARRS